MKFNLILFIALVCVFLPLSTHAGEFVGLVGIPGIEPNGDTDLNAYINALYRLSISIAALLAVIKIVAAGAKYMLTDIVPAKEEAKKDIQGALIGLLIVIGAIIILNTVNSDLTQLNLAIPEAAINDSGPTVAELIARQQRSIEERALENDARVGKLGCLNLLQATMDDWFSLKPHPDRQEGETNEQACDRVCTKELKGIYTYKAAARSTCDIEGSSANMCDPQKTSTCCQNVKGGVWGLRYVPLPEVLSGTAANCNQLEEAIAVRKKECATKAWLWKGSDATGYCSTIPLAPTLVAKYCPSGLSCKAYYCTTDEDGYCERGDTATTFTQKGSCTNLNGFYDDLSEMCVIPD